MPSRRSGCLFVSSFGATYSPAQSAIVTVAWTLSRLLGRYSEVCVIAGDARDDHRSSSGALTFCKLLFQVQVAVYTERNTIATLRKYEQCEFLMMPEQE